VQAHRRQRSLGIGGPAGARQQQRRCGFAGDQALGPVPRREQAAAVFQRGNRGIAQVRVAGGDEHHAFLALARQRLQQLVGFQPKVGAGDLVGGHDHAVRGHVAVVLQQQPSPDRRGLALELGPLERPAEEDAQPAAASAFSAA
jgi:hypothetical protein